MCRMVALIGQHLASWSDAERGTLSQTFLRHGRRHQAGWGVASHGQEPRIVKTPHSAHQDPAFSEAVHQYQDRLVLWHLRFATRGGKSVVNTHPFQSGEWLFCHNGTLPLALQAAMRDALHPPTAGDTDSEVFMHWLLHHLDDQPAKALEWALRALIQRAPEGRMNFLLTNGRELYAFRYGHALYWHARPGGVAIASHPLFPGFHPVARGELLEVRSDLAIRRHQGLITRSPA